MTDQVAVAVVVPRVSVNDDFARLVEWLVDDGAPVRAGDAVAVLDTTKSTFDLEVEQSGYLFRIAREGDDVEVGAPVAMLSGTAERPDVLGSAQPVGNGEGPIVTAKAQQLMTLHGVTAEAFSGLAVVRTDDVEAHLAHVAVEPAVSTPSAEEDEWSEIRRSEEYLRAVALIEALRRTMKAKFDRHVPIGELFSDRRSLAAEHGFGHGTSVYDDALILGDVSVGAQCWIGPNTVLDGAHAPLVIGDHSSVGAGSHVYTHDTIERTLTGNRAAARARPTTIGACCFIAPHVVIGPGSQIGDHSFVASGSYVEGQFPAYSYLAGRPAQRVGHVTVTGDRARIIREGSP